MYVMSTHTQIYKSMYSILVVFAPAAVLAVIGMLWGGCVWLRLIF